MLKSVIIIFLLSVSPIYAFYGHIGYSCSTDPNRALQVCAKYTEDLLKCVSSPGSEPNSGNYKVIERCGHCCNLSGKNDAICTKSEEECKKKQLEVLHQLFIDQQQYTNVELSFP